MTAALNRQFVPALESRGFMGSFPRYRRQEAGVIRFLMIAYDRPGTCFFLEFGSHPPDAKTTSWGEVLPEEELLLEHVDFQARARMQARCDGGSMSDQWFQFGDFGDDDACYDTLARNVAAMLVQMEAWYTDGSIGPNVSANGH